VYAPAGEGPRPAGTVRLQSAVLIVRQISWLGVEGVSRGRGVRRATVPGRPGQGPPDTARSALAASSSGAARDRTAVAGTDPNPHPPARALPAPAGGSRPGCGQAGYPAEFRRKVLDLTEAGRSVAAGTDDLGISEPRSTRSRVEPTGSRVAARRARLDGQGSGGASVRTRRPWVRRPQLALTVSQISSAAVQVCVPSVRRSLWRRAGWAGARAHPSGSRSALAAARPVR
jgi:hypothetical protein